MKFLLSFLFFLFFFSNAFSKEKFTEKCDGFCEGENLKIEMAAYPQPSYRIINGKRKKSPMWVQVRAVRKPQSLCIPFDSYISRAIPLKLKKKDFDKYMDDFRKGSEIFEASYNINACRPCPPGIKSKTKTGYCTVPMIILSTRHKTGWDKGYFDPNEFDLSLIGFGRDYSSDKLVNLSEAINTIAIEILSFPISYKEEIGFMRLKDKETNQLVYLYSYTTYKTAAREQVTKQTELQMILEQNLTNYLSSYIENIQSVFTSVFDKRSEDFKNISKLYELIPTDDDLSFFKNNFEKVSTFHTQNRN